MKIIIIIQNILNLIRKMRHLIIIKNKLILKGVALIKHKKASIKIKFMNIERLVIKKKIFNIKLK
jgi:hypothetical protein